jgi:hypothetical protein
MSPWRAIADAASEAEVDVIVCGSRGQGPFSRALLGSTSSSLLYHADRSVLVVPPGGGDLDGPMLIGYDGVRGSGSGGRRGGAGACGATGDRRSCLVVAAGAILRWPIAGDGAAT